MVHGTMFWISLTALVVIALVAAIWRKHLSFLSSVASMILALMLMIWLFDNGYWPQETGGQPPPALTPAKPAQP